MNGEVYSHLSSKAADALSLPISDRIFYIRDTKWIGYPRAKMLLDQLNELMSFPQNHRMPNLLIVGDTNNGKTMIVQRFQKQYPASCSPNGETANIPVLYIQAPPIPDESRFYNIILDKLVALYKQSDRVDKKQSQAIGLLRLVNLKLLIIDEIHHILAGNLNKQRQFLNVLKYLGNELMVPIVAVGTKDALRAIQTDPQLANRFHPAILPRWKFDTEYLQLLASFEKIVPLKYPSGLTKRELAQKILVMSEGIIGEMANLICQSAIEAIKSGSEKITLSLLNNMNWISPSDRKRSVEIDLL